MALHSESEEIVTSPSTGKDAKSTLTTIALCIIAGAIILVMLLLCIKSFDASSDIHSVINSLKDSTSKCLYNDSIMTKKVELVKSMQEEKKDYREFFLKVCQMILLNLLLPILTAILGYKVGARSKDED